MEKVKDLLRTITVALKKGKAAGILVNEAKKVTVITIPSMSDSGLESYVWAQCMSPFFSCEHFMWTMHDLKIEPVLNKSKRSRILFIPMKSGTGRWIWIPVWLLPEYLQHIRNIRTYSWIWKNRPFYIRFGFQFFLEKRFMKKLLPCILLFILFIGISNSPELFPWNKFLVRWRKEKGFLLRLRSREFQFGGSGGPEKNTMILIRSFVPRKFLSVGETVFLSPVNFKPLPDFCFPEFPSILFPVFSSWYPGDRLSG